MIFKTFVQRSELNKELAALEIRINRKLDIGSSVMSSLNSAVFAKPKPRNLWSYWVDFGSSLWGSSRASEPETPEPRNRIEVLEQKLDLVMQHLSLEVNWSQGTDAHYKLTAKPNTAEAKKPAKRKR